MRCKRVSAAFDGGVISSDGGLVPLREAEMPSESFADRAYTSESVIAKPRSVAEMLALRSNRRPKRSTINS